MEDSEMFKGGGCSIFFRMQAGRRKPRGGGFSRVGYQLFLEGGGILQLLGPKVSGSWCQYFSAYQLLSQIQFEGICKSYPFWIVRENWWLEFPSHHPIISLKEFSSKMYSCPDTNPQLIHTYPLKLYLWEQLVGRELLTSASRYTKFIKS